MTTSSYCYRLYAGNGNWITLGSKTTQDLLEIFKKGVACRYPLTDQLFIDIIPHDVDCNSKNIDMVGLMRADLVYEPLDSEAQVQQSMSYYIHSLLNEQGIIDAFPPLRSDGDLPDIASLPTHRHLSLVPSTVNSTKRRTRQSDSSKQQHSRSLSPGNDSESPNLEMNHPFPPLATVSSSSSSAYGFNIPTTPSSGGSIKMLKKEKAEGKSSHSSSSSVSLSSASSISQKNLGNSGMRRPYQTRSNSSSYRKKKYPQMSSTNLEHSEHRDDNDSIYDRMNSNHHVDNIEWLSSSVPSLWMPNTSYPSPLRGSIAFYHNHAPPLAEPPETTKLEQHDSNPIFPAEIMHHYHRFATKGPIINISSNNNTFDMMERTDCPVSQSMQEGVNYNDSDNSIENLVSPIPTSSPWAKANSGNKKQMIGMSNWEENSSGTTSPTVDVMHCLDYEKYLPHPPSSFNSSERGDIKSRSNILSHQ